jgi:hypothetical protein
MCDKSPRMYMSDEGRRNEVELMVREKAVYRVKVWCDPRAVY